MLRAAGDACLRWFHRARPEHKPDGTHVTDADRAAEEVLVEGLSRAFPDASVVSEEGTTAVRGEATWYVDPLDGTTAFLEGLAHWGPTVCLVQGGELVAGGLWMPVLGELWTVQRGRGAWWNGARLPLDQDDRPLYDRSLYLPSRFHRRQPIRWPGKVRALGSTASHLARVASGGAAAVIIPKWEIWDVGCGVLLVEETGRVVTDFSAQPVDPVGQPGEPLLAGSRLAVTHLAEVLPTPKRA